MKLEVVVLVGEKSCRYFGRLKTNEGTETLGGS